MVFISFQHYVHSQWIVQVQFCVENHLVEVYHVSHFVAGGNLACQLLDFVWKYLSAIYSQLCCSLSLSLSHFLSLSLHPLRHSIVTLWRSLAGTNPELLVDFEEFVGEVAEEVEHAQRALE